MTQDKHRETARDWVYRTLESDLTLRLPRPMLIDDLTQVLATTEAEAKARGRGEAKAEDAQIARSFVLGNMFVRNATARAIADAILASSPGPSLEERVRAEIAEAVKGLRRIRNRSERDGMAEDEYEYVCRDDVLAIIERGGK